MPTIYDETIEAWRREFHNPDLQDLRADLFRDVAAYVRRLKEARRNLDQRSLKAILLEEEMSRLEQLVIQLVDRRMAKIWEASRANTHVTADASEKWAQEQLANLSRYYRKFKEDALQGIEPSYLPEKKTESLLLRFVKDIPSIIGVDLKTHGPFNKEDIAILPYENAESLVRQGTAVEIRTAPQGNE